MNTNNLKRFAQTARRKLMEQVGARLEFLLTTDSPELREKSRQIEELRKELKQSGKAELIEKVAYTWFNRLVALRYMDVNDYQPSGIRIITPANGFTQPQAITEAKQGNIPAEWKLEREKVLNLLDGRMPSTNPQNEAFRVLLVAACNHLNRVFPFLFEKIDDYSELLFPDDLTSRFSIVNDVTEGLSPEDCQAIEVIGWLYQFYVSERKDEVFASKEKVKKEDIPAATQLFTPRWIVEYMVQNSVGKLWMLNHPDSQLKASMPYYIEPAEPIAEFLKISSPTEIQLLDQACGSGHILVYGFELLYKIYEEEGFNPSEIPSLILENNLMGFEIDSRAAQLASFALMMKARETNRRAFRKELKPDIVCFSDFRLTGEEIARLLKLSGIDSAKGLSGDLELMRQATNFGSLIQPKTKTDVLEDAVRKTETALNKAGLFDKEGLEQLYTALKQLYTLSRKVTCVVDNPPYMGGGNMNKALSDFVKEKYPDSKADLMACFMECGLEALQPKGYLGMINQHSWMFLSSYERLREELLKTIYIETLLHLGPRTFPEIGGEVVQNAAFTMVRIKSLNCGSYIRLVDFYSSEEKSKEVEKVIKKEEKKTLHLVCQDHFRKIPGNPICYWLEEGTYRLFNEYTTLDNISFIDGKNVTGNNDKHIRLFWECEYHKIGKQRKYIPLAKGGDYRKWYGNTIYVVNWSLNAQKEYKETYSGRIIKKELWYKNGITFSRMAKIVNCRILDNRGTFDGTTVTFFMKDKYEDVINAIISFFNSKVGDYFVKILNPTLVFQYIDIKKIPILKPLLNSSNYTNESILISKIDWNYLEISLDYMRNRILDANNIGQGGQMPNLYYNLLGSLTKQFFQIHQLEENNNKTIIDIYSLQQELTQDVPLEEITILQHELDREILPQLNKKLIRDPVTNKVLNYEEIELPFNHQEILAQFVSYAVGCMFGRFSLDKPGLILANQGETLEDYIRKVSDTESTSGSLTFLPDEDNIIPVLDDDWFEDDITGRFKKFLKASFGTEHYEKNLAFVEECLGKDIRSWFFKDFYSDHIRRYKKRPIYWMFSSPRGSFNALIYMHRYTPDTVSLILNGYLRQYQDKLRIRKQHLQHVQISGTNTEKTQALRETERIERILLELQEYERDILYPLAAERISIDLDDGVLVNYNRFGKAVKEVAGLNDAATKKKVKAFDWVNTSNIK
jgi:type II restriction/modification system DNA methylase subunit YeeA